MADPARIFSARNPWWFHTLMIFVAVGNARQSFDRLVNAAAALGRTGQNVIVQHGHTRIVQSPDFTPVAFLSSDEFDRYLHLASVIVCHGGCGTVLQSIRAGKVPVVVPRRKHLREHVNDHQLELAEELARQGYVVACHDVRDLSGAIARAQAISPPPRTGDSKLATMVGTGIRELLSARTR
jgi:UDP-N-acetylglucosamine transferase subunit ALG13